MRRAGRQTTVQMRPRMKSRTESSLAAQENSVLLRGMCVKGVADCRVDHSNCIIFLAADSPRNCTSDADCSRARAVRRMTLFKRKVRVYYIPVTKSMMLPPNGKES